MQPQFEHSPHGHGFTSAARPGAAELSQGLDAVEALLFERTNEK